VSGIKSWLQQPEAESNVQAKIARPEKAELGAELG